MANRSVTILHVHRRMVTEGIVRLDCECGLSKDDERWWLGYEEAVRTLSITGQAPECPSSVVEAIDTAIAALRRVRPC